MPTTLRSSSGVLALAVALTLGFRSPAALAASGDLRIIPLPAATDTGVGRFLITPETRIILHPGSRPLQRLGLLLQAAIQEQCGLKLAVADKPAAASSNCIQLRQNDPPTGRGAEAYELSISPNSVLIQANEPAGIFYGIQSLRQIMSPLLSPDVKGDGKDRIRLPAVHVIDQPRFAWRGLMLDCSRTFLPIDCLKKYVDVCSFYKMNVLHLHLTDDQGWRLEIRSHPRLTEVGSKFDPRFPGEASGYYTQEQIRELVRYAEERHVTLVPEIEMPGHCLALLKSYPELSCRGGADEYVIAPYLFMSDRNPKKDPPTPYGALCPGNEKTFQVLEDILNEVMEVFPGEYIHIAGDECPKGYWKACPKCQARMKAEGLKNEEELQSYFVKRVAKMIQARGRKVFGWDETLEGGLAPGLAVMSWRSFEAGIAAARLGHPVAMAPKSHLYFDYGYNRTPASLVYSFEPIPPELNTPQLRPLVLGGEACMWTHLARTEAGIDMSIFPRLLALAEVLWTPAEARNWDDFSRRLKLHEGVLQSKGVTCFAPNAGLGLPNLTWGQDGRLWLINGDGTIYLRKGDGWERFPGKARQVTSTPDGAVWSVSTRPATRGYALMRWSEPAHEWQPLGDDIAAVQISAAPDDSLWASTEAYAIWRYADGKWANVLGLAHEVSVGADGTAWILTMDPGPGGFELYSAPPGSRFRRVQPPGNGRHIAAGGTGQVWVSLADDRLRLYHRGEYCERPGRLISLAAHEGDSAWGLSRSPEGLGVDVVRWTGSSWEKLGLVP